MLFEDFKKLGLKRYEAEVYATLVGLGEATAREIAECSSVPRTKVYEALKNLADLGFVEVEPGNPTMYKAQDPEEVVRRLEAEILEAARRIVRRLREMKVEHGNVEQPVWVVRGDWAVGTRVRRLISRVKAELCMEIADYGFFERMSEVAEECARKASVFGVYWNFSGGEAHFPKSVDIVTVDPRNIPDELRADSYVCYRLKVGKQLKRKNVEYEPVAIVDIDERYNVKVFRENGKLMAVVSTYPMTAIWHRCAVRRIWEFYSYR